MSPSPLVEPALTPPPVQLQERVVDGVPLLVLDEGHAELAYGGNKVRKLVGILAEAARAGAQDLVTFGAWGSHHVYATALWGAQLGLRTHAIWIRQPETEHVRRMAEASHAVCASVQAVHSVAELPMVTAALMTRLLAASGRPPLRIPPGGSSREGTRGWVEVAASLPRWMEERGMNPPSAVVVASGSGGTAAGLLATGWPVHAVRVGPRALTHRSRLRRLARAAGAQHLGVLQVEHDYRAGGYGQWDARTLEACAAGRAAGMPTETTYTAKSLACALDMARAGQRVLYVQTASAVPPRSGPPLPAALLERLRTP